LAVLWTFAGSWNVSVIDAATNTITATIDVGFGPVAFGQSIGPNVLTPVQKIEQTVDSVQDLVTSGALNQGQANALIAKINATAQSLNAGDTNKAIDELNAFINQVKAYMKTGKLSSTEGQALVGGANAVINALKTN
jgi:YVTN family beta-propeller protein